LQPLARMAPTKIESKLHEASDLFSDEVHDAASAISDTPAWRDLVDLARSWSHPADLATKLKALMTRRPMVALGAAVAIGALLHGRVSRSRRFY
jgi:hypothetical protein